MTKKIKGCGYCLFGETVCTSERGEYVGISDDDKIIAGIAFSVPLVKARIMYCPWCGTKLFDIPKNFSEDDVEIINPYDI